MLNVYYAPGTVFEGEIWIHGLRNINEFMKKMGQHVRHRSFPKSPSYMAAKPVYENGIKWAGTSYVF